MLSEYVVQFGIIILPITLYQIWAFGKSFSQLPWRSWILGLYGGAAGILCQLMPVHILGHPENFQCVPIIVSILYGKRRAGLLAIALLSGYQFFAWENPHDLVASLAGILIYSAIPMLLCMRFDKFPQKKRFRITQLLSVVIIGVEMLFIIALFLIKYGKDAFHEFFHYANFLFIACIIQITMMAVVFFLIESILETGRIRHRQESLIKYNPIGISVFDMNHCFVAVNPAYEAMTGYKENELLGKSRLFLWNEEQHEFAQQLLDEVLTADIKRDVEATLRHKKGHAIPVCFTLVPMLEGAEITGYFVMLTDITESKVAEEFVRNSEKLSAIGQLSAGVAHEIRNPLTAIKGFLQLLFSSGSPAQAKYYEVTMSEVSRIEGIVSEMLVLAKPQAASFKATNLRSKLEEVAYLITGEANMQNVQIEMDLGDSSPDLMADENQLKQVFLNLGKNAIDAMPGGGTLSISMQEDRETVIVKFMDTGTGIPEEMLKKIGEPFFTTKSTGTGLGFLISKRIVSNHNGTMHIQSEQGKGTTIELHLPLKAEA
ncbi:PAS domain-containing sensor histidine kinase [Paenibacillus hexagrammi]|uniref:histidine kinase n=1 Tax=Paenibacillus hexagrammi TaxID=2908839 RepID=A0ABY3SLQ0_9BACL|nr:PAS domain-containing sensor histidine kinase [Paenibacillus sp. YPD9-1]UJF34979.1 ATP-binding protein [Paenibacillus sp. YPD9-1]